MYNLHTHTTRCNHAVGTDREYVEAAIHAGMTVLGFSDHCPQFFPVSDYYSHFRMRPELAEDYVYSLRQLKKEYEKDIKILIGFETEYYPKTFRRFMRFIKPLELDYLIMGQHFVGNEYDIGSYYAGRDCLHREYIKEYVDQVIEGLNTGVFTYLAHPDIVNYEGDIEYYKAQMTRLCKHARKMKLPLEYNILGYTSGKCYPNPIFWRIASEIGCKTVLGFDAHNPLALLNSHAYAECLDELSLYGIEPIRFSEIKIRALPR